MLYIFCAFTLLLGTVLFYYWKQIKSSRQIRNSISMQIFYRFHNIEGQYSGNGRSKNGALIFAIERTSLDIRNVVIKDVKLNNSNFTVRLEQLVMISFPSDSLFAHEASIRFRIKGAANDSVKWGKQYATIKGYVTLENSDRIPLRLRVSILALDKQAAYDQRSHDADNDAIGGLVQS
jgi:hypothetical protein